MDKAFLQDCLAKGMSLPQIGELVGRPPGTVGYWVKKHGLTANGSAKFSQKGPLPRQVLEQLVEEGRTLREMSELLGASITRVHHSLRHHQIDGTRKVRRMREIRAARAAGRRSIVLDCHKHGRVEFMLLKTIGVRCRRCNSESVAKRRRKVKAVLVKEGGGRCQICGYDKSKRALHFHHLDPAQKIFAVGQDGVTRSIAAHQDRGREVHPAVRELSHGGGRWDHGGTATIARSQCRRVAIEENCFPIPGGR